MTALRTRVDGVEYTPTAVEGIRAELIQLRDSALGQGHMEWAVSLSWAIAYLGEYRGLLAAESGAGKRHDGSQAQEQDAHRQGQGQDLEQAQDSDQDQDQSNDQGDVHD